jgi:hypothetical protein
MPCSTWDLNIDFGYRFFGTNSLNGTIWHDDDSGGQSAGIGDIDDSGNFYAGVTVYLRYCGLGTCSDGDEYLAGTAVTNVAGQYSFPDLANGTYIVSINNNDFYLAGTDFTTTNIYDNTPGNPWVVLTGGTNAVRDFGRISQFDTGDLPATYTNSLLADNGARHRLVPGSQVKLGALIDADPNGQEDNFAKGDDTDPDSILNGNDDDGITRFGTWMDGTNGGKVTVVATCPSNPCYLSAWIDWNNDNDFNDSGERILLDVPVVNGSQVVSFNVPAGTFPGSGGNKTFNARFRLYRYSTGGLAQTTGLVINGEVEDYQWSFSPTAISLRQLSANGSFGNNVWSLLLVFVGLIVTTTYLIGRNRRKVIQN